MPRTEYSERFASDLALVTSLKAESRILEGLDNIECLGEFGSSMVPESIKKEFGAGVARLQ